MTLRAVLALTLAAVVVAPPAAHADEPPGHREPRWGIDLRLAVPDGLGATVTMSPSPRVTLGLGAGTLLGTFAITPEATLLILPRNACTPTLTAKLSTVIFTPLMDGAVNAELERIYGDAVTVDMAGRVMEVAQGLAGVDCALRRVHLVARAGYAWQLGSSFGGGGDDGDLSLSNWHGPTLDLGLRWSLR
jgi:hypothetical protein